MEPFFIAPGERTAGACISGGTNMNSIIRQWSLKALVLPTMAAGLLLGQPAGAQQAREGDDSLSARTVSSDRLRAGAETTPLSESLSYAAASVDAGWQAFAQAQSVEWTSFVDRRTGKIDYAEGGNLAWIPGAGNNMAAPMGGVSTMQRLESLARLQVANLRDALGVDPASLVLNPGRSGQRDHVWFVDFDVMLGGRR